MPIEQGNQWTCVSCGQWSAATAALCSACGLPRRGLQAEAIALPALDADPGFDEDDTEDASWGTLSDVEVPTSRFHDLDPSDESPFVSDDEVTGPIQISVRSASIDEVTEPFGYDEMAIAPQRSGARKLLPGEIFARRYRIQECTFEDGNSRRYLAIQEPMVRRVLLTVLDRDLDDRVAEALEDQFLQDAQRVAFLDEPELARVYDFGRTDRGVCYAATELVYGLTLRDVLHWGPMPPARLLPVLESIAQGLHRLHTAGVVHRRLRSESVVLQPLPGSGELARLTGYGFDLVPETFLDNTDEDAARYSAPELSQGAEADAASDIYAFGVLLYRAASGHVPFDYLSVDDILDAHHNEPFPGFPVGDELDIPHQLEVIARKCLEKSPSARYVTPAAVLHDIRAARDELFPAVAPAPAPAPAPLAEPASRPGLLLIPAVVAAATAAVVLSVGGAFLLHMATSRGLVSEDPVDLEPMVARTVEPMVAGAVEPLVARTVEPIVTQAVERSVALAMAEAAERAEAVQRAGAVARDEAAARARAVQPKPAVQTPRAAAVVPQPVPPIEQPEALDPISPPVEPVQAATEPAEAPPAAADPRPPVPVAALSALSGRWTGKAAGDSAVFDLEIREDGRVAGDAILWVDHYELLGDVQGRLHHDDDAAGTVELQVTVDELTTTFSGELRGDTMRGRMYVGANPQGRWVLRAD